MKRYVLVFKDMGHVVCVWLWRKRMENFYIGSIRTKKVA